MAARATKTKTVAGRVVSAASKTGDPGCSAAMSQWVRTRKAGATPAAVFAKLAECRSKAHRNRKATLAAASGKVAGEGGKTSVQTVRGTWQRAEKAKQLVESRRATRMQAAPAAPARPSIREQAAAHRAAKGDRAARIEAIRRRGNQIGGKLLKRDEESNKKFDRLTKTATAKEVQAKEVRGKGSREEKKTLQAGANDLRMQAGNESHYHRTRILPRIDSLKSRVNPVLAAAKPAAPKPAAPAQAPPPEMRAALARRARYERLGGKDEAGKINVARSRMGAIDSARAKLAERRAAKAAPKAAPKPAPAAPKAAPAKPSPGEIGPHHVDRLHKAFDAEDAKARGSNFVRLDKLRDHFPELSDDEWSKLLRKARIEHGYTAETHEGVVNPPDWKDRLDKINRASIRQGNTKFVYLSRR